MSKHLLRYREKKRQITSHFGSIYLFKSKLTFMWSHKLWHHFQWSTSRLVAVPLSLWKGKCLSLKEGCSNMLSPSSHYPITQQPSLFCPQQEFHRVENTSISHITRWKVETQTARRCTACFSNSYCKSARSLFTAHQCNTLENSKAILLDSDTWVKKGHKIEPWRVQVIAQHSPTVVLI